MPNQPKLTDEQRFAAERSAAITFKDLHPEYIACQTNWDILREEAIRQNQPSCDVKAYLDAFEACKDKLKLKSPDEIPEKPLTEADIERMPADEFKHRVVIPEFRAAQARRKQ